MSSDTGLREHADAMIVGAINSLSFSSIKRKVSSVPSDGYLSALEFIFQETATQARTSASNRLTKTIRASYDPRVSSQSQAKKRVSEGTKSSTIGSKGVKSSGQNFEAAFSGLENLKSATSSRFIPLTRRGLMMNGVLGTTTGVWMNGLITRLMLDDMKITNRHTTYL